MKHQFGSIVSASAYLLTFSGALLAQPARQAVPPANQTKEKDDHSWHRVRVHSGE